MSRSLNEQGPTTAASSKYYRAKKLLHALVESVFVALFFFLFLACLPPFVLLLIIPFFIYHRMVILLAKIFRSDLVCIIAARDIVVGLSDVTKKNVDVTHTVVTYHGEPDIEHIRSTFQVKVMEERDAKVGNLLYEKLTYFNKHWLGYGFWSRESNFSLHEHIRFCEDTEQLLMTQSVIAEEDLLKVMGNLVTRPFRKGTSPWEILIVRNFVPSKPKIHNTREQPEIHEGPKFILICRMHHSIGDGYCVFKMFVQNLGGVKVAKISPSWTRTFCSAILTNLATLVLFPYYQFKSFHLNADKNIWKLPSSQMTREWLTVRSEKIPLTGLKNINKSQNVSLTALFFAGLGGGIRTFFKRTGQEDKIPEIMRSTLPFQWKSHPLTGLVNCWTFGAITIPLGASFPQNLQTAEKSILSLRKSPIVSTNFVLLPIFAIFPIWLCKILLNGGMGTVASSNFPGPKDPHQSFDRYWLDDITFWLELRRGIFGISVTFLTCLDNLRVAVTLDKRIIPTQEKADYLALCINEEFKNILDMDHVNEDMELDDTKIV